MRPRQGHRVLVRRRPERPFRKTIAELRLGQHQPLVLQPPGPKAIASEAPGSDSSPARAANLGYSMIPNSSHSTSP